MPTVSCPECKIISRVPDTIWGKKVKCPCGEKFVALRPEDKFESEKEAGVYRLPPPVPQKFNTPIWMKIVKAVCYFLLVFSCFQYFMSMIMHGPWAREAAFLGQILAALQILIAVFVLGVLRIYKGILMLHFLQSTKS